MVILSVLTYHYLKGNNGKRGVYLPIHTHTHPSVVDENMAVTLRKWLVQMDLVDLQLSGKRCDDTGARRRSIGFIL